jgi:hypothetical protein
VSEWLDLMLEEIARKQREAEEADAENLRRKKQEPNESAVKPTQSK